MKSLELTRALLFGQELFSLFPGLKKKGGGLMIVAVLGLVTALAVLEVLVVWPLCDLLVSAGGRAGHPELVFSFLFLVNSLLTVVSALPLAGSLVFAARDQNLLQLLPVPPKTLATGKYLAFLALTVMAPLFLTVPALIQFWLAVPFAWPHLAGVLGLVFGVLFLPVLVALAFQFFLTAVLRLARFRQFFEMAGLVLLMTGLIFLQTWVTRSSGASGVQVAASLVPFVGSVQEKWPLAAWAADAFSGAPGWASLWFWLVQAACVAASLALLGRWFGTSRDTAEVVHRRQTRAFRPRPLFWTLVRREWTVLSSKTLFLFEGIGLQLVLPLLLALSFLAPATPGFNLQGWLSLSLIFANTQLLVLGALCLILGLQHISSTSLSREGQTLALALLAPVPGRLQVLAKAAFHGLTALPQLGLFFGYLVWLGMAPLSLLLLLVGGLGFGLTVFSLQIRLDLRRPRLDWTNPLQAMKQNPNALWGMGLGLLVLLVHAAGVWLALAWNVNAYLLVWLVPCLLAAEGLLSLVLLLRRADAVYAWGEMTGA